LASASSFLGGQFLKAEALKASGPVRAVISGTKVESFEAKGSEPARNVLALVLDLGTEEKTLTLNKTNLRILIGAYGDNTDAWVGKQVVAFHDPNVSYGGRTIGGVRIKVPMQQKAAPAPVAAVPVDESDIPF
jgi:hypothetical protein